MNLEFVRFPFLPPHTYVSQGKRIHLWSWICLAYIIPLLLPVTDSKLGIFWLMTCEGKVCWGLEEYFPFPNRKLEEALFLLVIYMSDSMPGVATILPPTWRWTEKGRWPSSPERSRVPDPVTNHSSLAKWHISHCLTQFVAGFCSLHPKYSDTSCQQSNSRGF